MRIRTLALASAALTTALVLAGCTPAGDDSDAGSMPGMGHSATPMMPTESSVDVNTTDQMFVQMMIPHHEQAIEMADSILDKDGVDQRILDLAQQIKDAQGPEIEIMNNWLDDWGVEATPGQMDGMDMGDGMMSDDDMAALESATGNEAARLFLEQMIVHHQGAITMAESEVNNGQNPDVMDLAQQVIDGQTAEITTMQELLGQL
jgi:uncharacterized protein (DUF305 family)